MWSGTGLGVGSTRLGYSGTGWRGDFKGTCSFTGIAATTLPSTTTITPKPTFPLFLSASVLGAHRAVGTHVLVIRAFLRFAIFNFQMRRLVGKRRGRRRAGVGWRGGRPAGDRVWATFARARILHQSNQVSQTRRPTACTEQHQTGFSVLK